MAFAWPRPFQSQHFIEVFNVSFFNDLSKSLFRSFQQICELNIQLTQTLLEETAIASQQMCTAERQTELFGAAAARAQPTTDKLRAYQQHVSRVAADSQVDLQRVAEHHVQETSRTARALAEECARTASDETERHMRSQQETMRKFADPFRGGDALSRANGGASMQGGQQGNVQADHASTAGGTPGGTATSPGSQQGGRATGGSGSARKET